MKKLLLTSLGLALGLAGCLGGSNASYYKMGISNLTVPNGNNCPSAPNPLVTFTGIDGDGTVAIYTQPNNSYLLDVGSGAGYTGSLNNGTYTFTGSDIVDTKGTPEVTTTVKATLTLTPQGSGLTGSYAVDQECVTSGSSGCQSANGNGFVCTQNGQIVATQIGNVQQTTVEQTNVSSAP